LLKTGLSIVIIVCKFFKKNLYDMNTSNYNAEKRNEKREAYGGGNENDENLWQVIIFIFF